MERPISDSRYRRKHTKSRTGCNECRMRHVKCDEKSPICSQCNRTGRKCSGSIGQLAVPPRQVRQRFKIIFDRQSAVQQTPSPESKTFVQSSTALTVPPSVNPTISMNPTISNSMHHDFFIHVTLPLLSSFSPSSLWTSLVGQLSLSQAVVQSAANAIGIRHQLLSSSSSQLAKRPPKPEQWYFRALSSLRELMSHPNPDRTVVVLACLLLVMYSLLDGRLNDALLHFSNGVKLITESHLLSSSVEKEVILQLHNFGTETLIFNLDARVHHLVSKLPLHRLHTTNLSEIERMTFDADTLSNDVFEYGSRLTFGFYEDIAAIDKVRLVLTSKLEALSERVNKAMANLSPQRNYDGTPEQIYLGCLQARMLFYTAFIPGMVSRYQTTFDKYAGTFRSVIEILESCLGPPQNHQTHSTDGEKRSPLSLKLGVIPLLLNCVSLCRNSRLRRRLKELFHRCPRREGIWDAEDTADVATAIINFEEQRAVHFDDGLTPPLISEEDRIHFVGRNSWLGTEPREGCREIFIVLKPYGNGNVIEQGLIY